MGLLRRLSQRPRGGAGSTLNDAISVRRSNLGDGRDVGHERGWVRSMSGAAFYRECPVQAVEPADQPRGDQPVIACF